MSVAPSGIRVLLACALTAIVDIGCAGSREATGTLSVAVGPDRYLNELPARPDLGKYPLNAGVFDPLVRATESFGIEPWLAARWTYDEPSNTYLFYLRRDVTFHDGQPLTAADVKFTYDLISTADPANYQQLGPGSVQVIDEHTVAVTPTRPNMRLAEQIAHPIWGINRQGSDPLRPVGTGPFRFEEYHKHDRIAVARNAEYWHRARRPTVDRVEFRFVPDADARFLAVRAGQVHVAADVPPEILESIATDPGLRVVRSPPGASNALTVNIHGEAPYNLGRDRSVRAAVAQALDRETIVARGWNRAAEPSVGWLAPAVFGPYATLVHGLAFNPAAANALLDQAGWVRGNDGIRSRSGRRLTLALIVQFPAPEHLNTPELIQQQLRAVGIDLRLELAADQGGFASTRRAGRFDLVQTTVNQNDPYPCFLPDLLHYSRSQSAATRYVSPGGETDAAIERCRAAADIEAARLHAAEAMHVLVDVEHVIIPIARLYRIFVTSDRVRDLVAHPSNTNQRWDTVRLLP